jgi:predicted cupin superfamily sugar epimerase
MIAATSMHPRASELISELQLEPHPEGGFFREVFRSGRVVQQQDARGLRAALTTIYFLLTKGQHSRWHRVASDEVWHFYAGEPLELFWVDAARVVHRAVLGIGVQVAVVPAGCWQAGRPLGEYALVDCTVGPGFDFKDFELLSVPSAEWQMLEQIPGLPAGLA